MKLQYLSLRHFRNYRELELNLKGSQNIALIGFNAQGKSNFLESLYTLAFAQSYRTQVLKEMIQWEQHFTNISGRFSFDEGAQFRLDFQISEKGKRVLKVNHAYQQRLGDYIGWLKLVFFSSQDLLILTGSPAKRRQFLDLLLAQLYPGYYLLLQRYQRVLKQRNQLLKKLKYQGLLASDELDIWDQQLSQYAAEIISRRLHVLNHLNKWIQRAHARVSYLSEAIRLQYAHSSALSLDESVQDMAEQLYALLLEKRSSDIKFGGTSVGPHRDDLHFFLGQYELKKFGSQGQIRTAALALKLAEMDYLIETTGEAPLLLLDDVFSELDLKRQQALLESIQNTRVQTFLTTTHLDGVAKHFFQNRGMILHVQEGQLFKA